MEKRKQSSLRLLDTLAVLMFITTFTPLILPQNEFKPTLIGVPYTMWMGFLVSTIFVLLTYFVAIIFKEKTDDH